MTIQSKYFVSDKSCFSILVEILSIVIILSQGSTTFAQIVQEKNPSQQENAVKHYNVSSDAFSKTTFCPQSSFQPTAREIWVEFLFGKSFKKNSHPQFAFNNTFSKSQSKTSNSSSSPHPQSIGQSNKEQIINFQTSPSTLETVQLRQSFERVPSTGLPALTPEQRRQRIEELDAFLKSKSSLFVANDVNPEQQEFLKPQPLRLSNVESSIPNAQNSNINNNNRYSDSKIKQTSGEVRLVPPNTGTRSVRNALSQTDASSKTRVSTTQYEQRASRTSAPKYSNLPQASTIIPTRPQALRISDRSFISTEVVKLPSLGKLEETHVQTSAVQIPETNPLPTYTDSSNISSRPQSGGFINSSEEVKQANVELVKKTFRPKSNFINPKDL